MLDSEPIAGSSKCGDLYKSVKLPTISMPTFDGSYEHWLEFRDTFLSLVHTSTEISQIQKFHYLKSSLKGSAELVIDSLEFSAANYSVAWELLLNRYNNSNLLVHNHVKALFSIQTITKESPASIRRPIDTILKNLRALKILGEPTDSWDTLIIYIVVSKLDQTTEREWEQYKYTSLNQNCSDTKVPLKIDDLLQFLKRRADMLETLLVSHSKGNHNIYNKKQNTQDNSKVHCNVSSNKSQHDSQSRSKISCVMCNSKHPLYSCQKFLDLNIKAKLDLLTKNNLCKNCLRSGHTVNDCRFGPCRKCNKKHNSIIHYEESDARVAQDSSWRDLAPLTTAADTVPTHNKNDESMQVNKVHSNAHDPCVQPVLLSTALVEIADKYQNYHVARALLDSGSQRCFITKPFCELLQIAMIQSTHEIRGVGNSVSQSTQICDIDIKSRVNTYSMRIKCFVLPQITSTLPAVNVQSAQFRIPDNVQLSNPQFLDSQEIDILIGADRFWDLIIEGIIRLPNGPFLQNTQLGWIISGPLNINTPKNKFVHCNFIQSIDTQSIDTQLRQFWELEELPKTQNALSDSELECEKSFVNNTTRDVDGRFCVRIPLKESADSLGKTYSQAERQFLALEKRLNRVPSYKQLYSDFIHEYINLGHMALVKLYGEPHFIMPHHGVFRAHSTTTKLRVVFNASAPSSSGKSFNDIQLVGPPIQGDLFAILLRFRQHKFTACADVEKMYRQVLVTPEQRDLQLILWRDDSSLPIDVYRLNTVTYGTASAPFLSCRCLKQLAADCTDCDVKRVINEDFYVDDMITGSDNKAKLLEICKNTANVLGQGCFPLRKWTFNFSLTDDQSGSSMTHCSKELSLGEHNQSKTLGLGWYNSSDEFHFTTEFESKPIPVTKRIILSTVSQIFDPLGILSPTVMLGKVLLQKLWLLKLGWDDEVPNDITRAWNRFTSDLSILNSIRVPRYVIGENPIRIELHIFTDASQTAYGTCLYIRTVGPNQVSMKLLCSKGKVAPLKPVSIPRLELCGALLGARLYDKVRDSLHRHFDLVMFWTDSTIVLGWLRMAPSLLKTFVQNRTTEIHELTKELPWRHVSGKDNPADLVSRGISLVDLSKSSLWWDGPLFLRDPEFSPSSSSVSSQLEIDAQELPEVKPSAIHALTSEHITGMSLFPFHRFSQFNRMSRAAAYALRFIHNLRNKNDRRTGTLGVDELRDSVNMLARLSQLESYPSEFKLLSQTGSLKTKHNLSKLNLFIGEDKLIRVGGRIEYSSNFNYDKKHPILISSKHHFSVLLFRYEHARLLHAAPQALLFALRERWWPVRGRDLAKKVMHQCIICTRFRGKVIHPLMGNLPVERITPTYPFMRCGVDYAGPMLVLNRKGRGAKTSKSFICLFVCFVTRAIHLELVSNLSSDAYHLALKRFISRRGKPEVIFSDNGRNFVGLMNEFKKFLSSCFADIVEYASNQQIKFKFIPAYSANFGGLWESGVKSCKYHLLRVLGNAHLTFEELSTLLTQVEAVLNSRPLSPLSSDPHDLNPLTPAHFLVGRPLTTPASVDVRDTPVHRLDRYQRLEQLRQHFWSRWTKEYISEMQTRIKWKQHVADLKADTLVVIKDDNLPPLKWQMGRVEGTIPGKDGIVRVADIRTASGVIRRAVTKLCPLFMDQPTTDTAEVS
ncbi:hypothetical protein ABMA28_015107 [Loxostege sticticalis]|uniref:Integrase catalytic domain-containing protein n=1 Tax=Loxostege sticticalis TaxID=481309 RepID=A0ABD0TEC7_LOXSC